MNNMRLKLKILGFTLVTAIFLFGCGGNSSSSHSSDDCSKFIGTWIDDPFSTMIISQEDGLIIVKIGFYYPDLIDGRYSATCQEGKLQINVPDVGLLDLTINGTGTKLFFYKDDWVKQ